MIVCVLSCATPGAVVTVKVAVVAPAATVTVAGGVATPEFEEDRATESPPTGAGPLMVSVPVEDDPPVTVVGFSVSETSAGGLTVSVADDAVPPFTEALMLLVAVALCPNEVTMKVVVVAPAGIVAVAGTVATLVVPESRVIARPAAGAGLEIVTVPVEGVPPVTVVGFRDRPVTVGAVTVRFADCAPAPVPAVIAKVAFVATGTVVTVNVPVVAPAATVAFPGTVADPLAELSGIERPPAGAGPLIVTVPVEETPPTTEVGLRLSAVSVGA